MPRQRPNNVTDEQIADAYARLRSTPKVCAELGLGQATASRALNRLGIDRIGDRANKWVPGEYPGAYTGSADEIVGLYRSGLSIRAVAQKIGRSTTVVVRRLRAAGVEARPYQGRGPDHSMWQGGRIEASQGYYRLWIADGDQMAPMRNHQGYVLEHRLVMARKLGRPLKRHETVHHINGNPTDNRPENLQLRQGKHGKHVAMRCIDCGSHNVAAVPLEEQK